MSKIQLAAPERLWLMDLRDLGPGASKPEGFNPYEIDFMERKGLIRWRRGRYEITSEGTALIADGKVHG